ncbi:MAG: hypothetical protein KGL58_02360, partial [Pseudomonadota bacterium]|nr:hypothetical protein [Pseudomonadota bacterium]
LDVGIGVVSGLVLGSILTHPAPVYAEPRVAYYAPQVEYAPPPPVYYYGPPRVDYYSGPPVVVYQRDDDDRCWHRCWRGDER